MQIQAEYLKSRNTARDMYALAVMFCIYNYRSKESSSWICLFFAAF